MSSTCYQLAQQWSRTAAGTFNYPILHLIPGGSSTSVGEMVVLSDLWCRHVYVRRCTALVIGGLGFYLLEQSHEMKRNTGLDFHNSHFHHLTDRRFRPGFFMSPFGTRLFPLHFDAL